MNQEWSAVARALPVRATARAPAGWTGPVIMLGLAALFFFAKHFFHAFEAVHLVFAAIVLTLYFANGWTRKLVVLAFPLIFFGIFFDYFRHIPFAALEPIHVREPYLWDQQLFGLEAGGTPWLFHEWIGRWLAHPCWDLYCGITYHLHFPMALILLVVFWKKGSLDLAERFGGAFFLMTSLALLTYFLYPAAAPWYVAKYGFAAPAAPVLGDAAGLTRFEALAGVSYLTETYKINSVVFGAIPSMHAGFATLELLYARRLSRGWFLGVAGYALSIWLSALYLQHHYLIDLLAGAAAALAAWAGVEAGGRQTVRRAYGFLFRWLAY